MWSPEKCFCFNQNQNLNQNQHINSTDMRYTHIHHTYTHEISIYFNMRSESTFKIASNNSVCVFLPQHLVICIFLHSLSTRSLAKMAVLEVVFLFVDFSTYWNWNDIPFRELTIWKLTKMILLCALINGTFHKIYHNNTHTHAQMPKTNLCRSRISKQLWLFPYNSLNGFWSSFTVIQCNNIGLICDSNEMQASILFSLCHLWHVERCVLFSCCRRQWWAVAATYAVTVVSINVGIYRIFHWPDVYFPNILRE